MSKSSVKKLVMVGILIALQVLLTRVFSVQLQTIRISFYFLPIAICAIFYGPLTGGLMAAVSDLIGFMLFPAGPFFPGFTVTAFLTGVAYGYMYHKPIKLFYTIVSVLIVCIVINLGLDTLWLTMLYDKGFFAILPSRIIKNIIMIPVQVSMIHFYWKFVVERFKESFA